MRVEKIEANLTGPTGDTGSVGPTGEGGNKVKRAIKAKREILQSKV